MQFRAGLKLLNYNKRVIIMCAYEHNRRAIWHELAMLNVKIEMISVHRQQQLRLSSSAVVSGFWLGYGNHKNRIHD